MKTIAKTALMALMLAGTAIGVAAPASAHVSVGIGFGFGPGYYGPPPPPAAYCDPYSRYYDPYYCDSYDDYYGPPVFIDGYWYDRPMRYRWYGGHREFWVNHGWREGHDRDFRGGGWHGGWHGDHDWHGGGGWHGGGHHH